MFDLLVSPFFDSQGGQIKVRFGGTLRVRPTPRKIKEKVLDLFQQGFGYCAVAKILGLNESTIKTYSLLYRSGDETSWVNSKTQKTNPQVLFAAVTEYLQSKYGYKQLAIKYGLRSSTIARGVKNYLKHGIVILPRGRNAMKRLQEQKAKLQQRIQQQDKQPLSKKECREMRDLLEVNIALLEVLEESDPDELKKKEYRQQRKRLQARLAYVRRVVS